MTFDIPKLRDLEAAVERRVALRERGKRVVLTNGVFDLLHVGHVRSLSEAAKRGDALFVAMNGDESVRALKGEGRPIFREAERAAVLGALEAVDTVVVFRERRLTKEIETLRPDVYVKSGDYSLDTLNAEERAALEAAGTSIEFVPYLEGFSTTGMIEKMKSLPSVGKYNMYEVKAELTKAEFDELEMLIFETEGLEGWNLYENFDDKGYRLQGIFDTGDEADAKLTELRKNLSFGLVAEVLPLQETDWKESYKEHFLPWSVGKLHWVPTWLKDEYELPDGHEAVWLDPGMAFGTGNHGTTRLCVEELIAFKNSGADLASARILDAGCGSGILAISAAKLGFEKVAGFDVDEDAVRIAAENAALNGVSSIEFYSGTLDSGFRDREADCVLANILAKTLLEYPSQLVEGTAPGGWLVLSGILGAEAESVRDQFTRFEELDRGLIAYRDEWAAIRFVKRP